MKPSTHDDDWVRDRQPPLGDWVWMEHADGDICYARTRRLEDDRLVTVDEFGTVRPYNLIRWKYDTE